MIKNIAVLESDGIGPEITKEGLKVLDAVSKKYGHTFKTDFAPFGASAYFSHGSPFPEQTKKICDDADAIIKGPVGLAVDKMGSIPIDQRPEKGAILPLRKRYDTFMNIRPIYLPEELAGFSPLKKEIIGSGINIIMIRELVGGIYFGDKTEGHETNNEYSKDHSFYSKDQITRIAHAAFKEAGKHKKLLTNVHKANVLATSRFWNTIVENIKGEYPDVEYVSILVDNAAFQLVKNPTQFNGVMLLENMQGDILTDEVGGIIGSFGLMPSACIGPEKGYVEPAHGSAPDIAGKNIANPYSMIGSIALMLEKCFDLIDESTEIWDALKNIFASGYRTHDLADPDTEKSKILNTRNFGDKIVDFLVK